MRSWLSVILAVALWSVSLAGGALYEVPVTLAPSVYDRAWSAALGGAEDVGRSAIRTCRTAFCRPTTGAEGRTWVLDETKVQ
jgi:hypothetical protein